MITRTADGWTAATEADVRAVLDDPRFGVPEASPSDDIGTVRWLRASVSRFVNGPAHERRRAVVEAELAAIDPTQLQAAAFDEASRLLTAGATVPEVARRGPSAALARRLGAADPDAVALAVTDVAAAYFPGASPAVEATADRATSALLTVWRDHGLEIAVARIALLVQGHDATATLIETLLAHGLPLDAVLRQHPPAAAMRRVAQVDSDVAAGRIAAGEVVVLDIAAASDPALLTFGAGLRPCPGAAQAQAAAAGVVAAVRARPS